MQEAPFNTHFRFRVDRGKYPEGLIELLKPKYKQEGWTVDLYGYPDIVISVIAIKKFKDKYFPPPKVVENTTRAVKVTANKSPS
jgi:ActR/RegA family two-component response regulator